MTKIVFSVLTRRYKQPNSLVKLLDSIASWPSSFINCPGILTNYDASSIYDGHKASLQRIEESKYYDKDTIFVMCHDDIEIISSPSIVMDQLKLCNNPNTGFVGVAGATRFDNTGMQGMWWNARYTGETRGFVFQGNNLETVTPNYFGNPGQVIVLDGVFLAIELGKLKKLGLEKPHYLSSNWDFYDIYMTMNAHMSGLNNYVVPITIKHESPGEMRKEWFTARDQFCKYNNQYLPITLNYSKTTGLPR